MPSDDFPNAPDMGRDFFNSRYSASRDQTPEKESAAPQHYQELDRLEPTLDYTPGGQLEQDVHTQLSDNARREYEQRMQKSEPPRDDYYINQIQERFDKQVTEAERQREEEQAREEAAEKQTNKEGRSTESRDGAEQVKAKEADKQAEQQDSRQTHSYEMPEASKDAAAPMQQNPPDQGAKLRPGHSGREDRDHSGSEHEH